MERKAEVNRRTKETVVTVRIDLDGDGEHEISTGIPFLDHMLAQVAVHGPFDLTVQAKGDLEIDDHHTVEDIGIVLGQALRQALGYTTALGTLSGLARYGMATIPMDEALTMVAIDLSGRGHLAYDVSFPQPVVGRFDAQLLEEFLRSFAIHGQLTLHVRQLAGHNGHHIAESVFKALGRALGQAVAIDRRRRGRVPSSKGVI